MNEPDRLCLSYAQSIGILFTMAMTFVWCGLVTFSLIYSLFAGTSTAVGNAAIEGSVEAVHLIIQIAGPICIWSGIIEVMRAGGLMQALSKLLKPVITRLLPSSRTNAPALESISANVSANMLGLGNAATPLGINAMRELAAAAGERSLPTKDMCTLIVLNTASVQLIPSTVAALRMSLGSAAPFDILPAVWVSSVCSVAFGLLAAKILSKYI